MVNSAPLILTVQFDEQSQFSFNEKRKKYFPPHLNFLAAHLTLFHHLPADETIIVKTIETVCSVQKPIELKVTQPASIGKGVAYKIESKVLIALHKKLQKEWASFLTTQDRQGLWPHVTIQNKVLPSEAKETLQGVTEAFVPFTAYGIGLTLWQYLNGPWQLYRQFGFEGSA